MRSLIVAACALALASCTPGAAQGPSPNPGGALSTTTIDVNLTLNAGAVLPAGNAAGFAPPSAMITLGSGVRFHNSDGFTHTASSLGPAQTFPAASPLGSEALQQFGGLLSQGFSSGNLTAGATSQTLIADQRGTYLYGCFYHYGSPMRGAIVVQ